MVTNTPLPQSGPVTINYVYDSLYRLAEANYSTGEFFHYTYDTVGNRLTEDTHLESHDYVYDIANRLASVNSVNYTFDANGNLLDDGTSTYAYDAANRLTSVNGTTTYAYNGLGDRYQQTVGSQTTTYVLDLNMGLTQVLDDGANAYLYGVGRISQINTGHEYFLGDALGSVRQLVDSAGEITFAKSYQPYGEVLSSAGSGESAFAYTGEQTDSNGLVYLRARYLALNDGRFLSRDTWPGDINSPLSLNRWNYVEGNPINRVDPSGQCFMIDGSNMMTGWRVWEYPIVGPCRDNSGPILPDEPHWHEYWSANLVCSEWLACSREEVIDVLSRFTFPGQNPLKPVQPNQPSFVAPFGWFEGSGIKLNGMPVEYLGAIRSFIFEGGLHVRNVSEPTHIFHKGQVDREVLQIGQAWYVVTHGTGNNIYFAMDVVNQVTGAGIFTDVDRMMRQYLEATHILNWIKGLDC